MYNLTKPQKLIYDMEKFAGGRKKRQGFQTMSLFYHTDDCGKVIVFLTVRG